MIILGHCPHCGKRDCLRVPRGSYVPFSVTPAKCEVCEGSIEDWYERLRLIDDWIPVSLTSSSCYVEVTYPRPTLIPQKEALQQAVLGAVSVHFPELAKVQNDRPNGIEVVGHTFVFRSNPLRLEADPEFSLVDEKDTKEVFDWLKDFLLGLFTRELNLADSPQQYLRTPKEDKERLWTQFEVALQLAEPELHPDCLVMIKSRWEGALI